METLRHVLSGLPPLAAALVGLALGALFSLWGRRGGGDVPALEAEIARGEAQARDLSRQIAKLRAEQRALSSLTRTLPQIAQNLNHEDLDEREIPKHITALVNAIFEPEQFLFYLVEQPEDARGSLPTLHLAHHSGLADVAAAVKRVAIGEGKIGWVASAKVEMRAEDWLNKSRMEGQAIEDNHPSVKLDIIGPIVSHEGGQHRLLGVLCVGSPASHPPDEKLMLSMVANLATIAYTNSRSTRKLRDLANYDGLTGLLNKRIFMGERLGLLINAAEHEASPLTVFVFDIDHFKKYNDTNGHLAGDDILRRVSQVISSNLRPGDQACRYGGEEFIVAMPGAAGPEGFAAAERIRTAIESTAFPLAESQPAGRVTISGGVAQFPLDGLHGKELIHHADLALYQAKAAGRNRIVAFRGVDIGSNRDEEPIWIQQADDRDDR